MLLLLLLILVTLQNSPYCLTIVLALLLNNWWTSKGPEVQHVWSHSKARNKLYSCMSFLSLHGLCYSMLCYIVYMYIHNAGHRLIKSYIQAFSSVLFLCHRTRGKVKLVKMTASCVTRARIIANPNACYCWDWPPTYCLPAMGKTSNYAVIFFWYNSFVL